MLTGKKAVLSNDCYAYSLHLKNNTFFVQKC